MKVVQIKGTNGSGKTTIARQLIAMSNDPQRVKRDDGKVGHIVLPDLGFIIIGDYVDGKATGGVDSLTVPSWWDGKERDYNYTLDYVESVVNLFWRRKEYIDYVILFEGVILSTLRNAVYDVFMDLENRYGVQPYFVVLKADYQECLKRIAQRSGESSVLKSGKGVKSKNSSIMYHTQRFYDQKYVRYLDVENTPKELMACRFMELIECT